jgi:hypothetical protein
MLQDHDRAERLAKQLEFFGLSAQALDSVDAFRLDGRAPAGGHRHGRGLQRPRCRPATGRRSPGRPGAALPLLFFSLHETDTPTRLAVRAGGQEFLTGTLKRPACWKDRSADLRRPVRTL